MLHATDTYICIIKIGAIQNAHSFKIPIFNSILPICLCSFLLLDLDLGTTRIWRPWKLSNFQDPPAPCPSTSKFFPPPWPWKFNFKRIPPPSPPPPPSRTNYGTTAAPCKRTNKIKAKTKPIHVTFKLTTRSIVRFSPKTMQ